MPETPDSLASSVSAPPLQRNVRSARRQAETQEKRGKKAEHSRGCYSVLFVAATQCYRVVAAWRRSSVPFLSLSLSLSLPSSLIHTDTLPCSVTCSLPRTRCMCAPRSAPSPSRPFLLPLARHSQNIDISTCCGSSLLKLTMAVNLRLSSMLVVYI